MKDYNPWIFITQRDGMVMLFGSCVAPRPSTLSVVIVVALHLRLQLYVIFQFIIRGIEIRMDATFVGLQAFTRALAGRANPQAMVPLLW